MAFTFLAATTVLQAQDPWSSFADRLRAEANLQGSWILVLRPQDVGPWALDPDLGRLLTTREFRIEGLRENPAVGAPANAPSQAPPWLLLAPGAARQKEGRGRLDGRQLLEELRSLGFVPRWERREAFLKLHPNHGPARIEALQETLGLGLARLRAVAGGPTAFLARLGTNPPDAVASTQLNGMFLEAATALRALARVPAWWSGDTFMLRRTFSQLGSRLPALMTEEAQGLREQVLEELQRDPGDEGLWNLWSTLASMTGQDARSVLDMAVPAPGQAWPPDSLVTALADACLATDDWAGLLEAMEALKRSGTRTAADREQWDDARYALALLELHRARALARLDRWEESAGAVGEARFLAGQRWRGFLPFLLRRGIPEALGERKAVFQPFLEGDPLPDPPMPPAPPRVRLLRLGAPAWTEAWSGLAKSPELAPWSSAELVLEAASADLERRLRERHGWAGPRWVLVAGTEVLASGEALPPARELAQRLAALAPSRLQRLDRFLEKHPSHKVARRFRLDLLRSRMPNRHLEPQLAEDARLLRARVKADEGWTPEPGLWQWAALKVLPTLDADLECWPDQAALWRDWLAWAKLHPRLPSALLMAQRLPLWGEAASWSSRLPAEVHKAVAEELRSSGRFEDMRQWFQAAWDGVDKRSRGRGPGAPGWLLAQRKATKEAIVDPLREALLALRRDAEVVALDQAVAAW